ncbi:MAG: hypothetical protein K0S49_2183, partial [Microbacterium sp.]|nr:hypothetical protein [Microbacterium sp.]
MLRNFTDPALMLPERIYPLVMTPSPTGIATAGQLR